MSIMDLLPETEMQVPISGTRGVNAAPPVSGKQLTATCPRCGKEFPFSPLMTAYRVTMYTKAGSSKRLMCSYKCLRAWEQEHQKGDKRKRWTPEQLRSKIAEDEALLAGGTLSEQERKRTIARIGWKTKRLRELEEDKRLMEADTRNE